MRNLCIALCACLCLFSLAACTPDDPQPKPILVSSTQIADYSNAVLRQLTTTNDSLEYTPANYRLTIYRLVYQTTLEDGSTVDASGIVFVPSQPTPPQKPYPILSYQHPTAFSNTEAPSGANYGQPGFSYSLYFATHGYIVVAPDYIGYGVADKLLHRYEHRQTLAQATVDMLLAANAFLAQKGISYTPQTFMVGYSEGGYATLSAQKLIEEKYSSAIPLAGTSCGAGPYDMSGFFDYITHNRTVGRVANYIYTWQVLSYNRIYGLNKPLTYYFKSPYAEQITESLNNAWTTETSFDALCTDAFKADLRNPTSAFAQALADDDLTNWTAQTPTRLIHSREDDIIPFLTTERTAAALKQRGSKNVNLVALPTGYHVVAEVSSIRRSLEWFQQLRQ